MITIFFIFREYSIVMHLNYQMKQSHDGAKFELVSNEVNDKDNKLAHEIHEQDEFERLLFDGADALRKVGNHINAKETLSVKDML